MIGGIGVSLLPDTLTIIDFTTTSIRGYQALAEQFETVYGYTLTWDLEEAALLDPKIGRKIRRQNVMDSFEPLWVGDIALARNILSGASQRGGERLIENMTKHAHVHIFEDKDYLDFHTQRAYRHVASYYDSLGWRLWRQPSTTTAVFATNEMYYALLTVERNAEVAIRDTWKRRRIRAIRRDPQTPTRGRPRKSNAVHAESR